MKTIEVKFPEIEGMRVSGATLDFENGCSVVEYVEEVKFKRGDFIFCGYDNITSCKWVSIVDDIDNHGRGRYIALFFIRDGKGDSRLKFNDSQTADLNIFRLATDSEKQLLFDALEKDGKYWDAEAMEVKEYERVPENIGIYCFDGLTLDNKGDELYIGFNDNKQILSTSDGIYTVCLNDSDIYSRVNCCLKPISPKDVKVGDTILCGDKTAIDDYFKISNSGWVYLSNQDTCIMYSSPDGDRLFKLIPIK